MGGAVPKRWRSVRCMLYAMHVSNGYATGPCISAAFIASSSTSAWLLSRGSQELGRALPRCGCMPVCGVSILFRLNICFGGIARLERQISAYA